jgi:hypothetical protein
MQIPPKPSPAKKMAGYIPLSLAVALGFATTARAQYLPTNTIDFSDQTTGTLATDSTTTPLAGMPAGISVNFYWPGWSFEFMDISGWAAWGAQYVDPNADTMTINMRTSGSAPQDLAALDFSSPVIIWSLDLINWSAGSGSTVKVLGKLAGNLQWSFNWGTNAVVQWITLTNGAFAPVDELQFVGPDWQLYATHILISDATGAPPYTNPPPLISDFQASPNSRFRGLGVPVNLVWTVDPNATITLDNGIGDVTAWTTAGIGSYTVSPTNTTTYTLTSQDGANVTNAQITVLGSVLPTNVGLMTFEDQSTSGTFNPWYNWNAPTGVYMTWTGWATISDNFGAFGTPNAVYPLQWPLGSTNILGGTNNATILFQDENADSLPIMVNSFEFDNNTNNIPYWGAVHIEGRLAGVVQWTFDQSQAVQWDNEITQGSGILIDELDFTGQWYHYANFALSTGFLPTPVLNSPTATNGQFQFSWDSVENWANYLVYQTPALGTPWSRVAVQTPTPTGATNTYSTANNNTTGFYRVMRVP